MIKVPVGSRSSQRGVIVITLALCLVVLFGFLGLAVDVGYMQWTKRRAQTAADAAAMTAIAERWRGGTDASADALALADAATNGFAHGSEDTTVAITTNGATGANAVVTATVTRVVPSYFMRVLGRDAVRVAARASGGIGSGSGCVYALNPTANNAFVVTGSSTFTLNCGVVVESSAGVAMQIHGRADIDLNGNTIGVVGETNVSAGTVTDGQVIEGMAPVGDPLWYMDIPTLAEAGTQKTLGEGTTVTVEPGIYCGGMDFDSGTIYNLQSGLYIIAGGRMTISAGATVNGTGVTFIFAEGSTYGCTGPAANSHGGIDINAGAIVNLSAPTSGDYENIVFFEDRDSERANGNTNTFNGGASVSITGGMYFPVSGLTLNGNLEESNFSMIIADTIKIDGNVDASAMVGASTGSSPIKVVKLIE